MVKKIKSKPKKLYFTKEYIVEFEKTIKEIYYKNQGRISWYESWVRAIDLKNPKHENLVPLWYQLSQVFRKFLKREFRKTNCMLCLT